MKREELKTVHDALSLLNSMVNSGEQHSQTSRSIMELAFEILKNDSAYASLPPAEGAEEIQPHITCPKCSSTNNSELAKNDRLCYDCNHSWSEQQPKLDPKKVQWSGYGELGNISQKPLQPTAEGAEHTTKVCFQCKEELTFENNGMSINNGELYQCDDCHFNEYGYHISPTLLVFQQQPTAEGAEEYVLFKAKRIDTGDWVTGFFTNKKIGNLICPVIEVYKEWDSGDYMESYEIDGKTLICLHAQQIADKMVEESKKPKGKCEMCGNPDVTSSFYCPNCSWHHNQIP